MSPTAQLILKLLHEMRYPRERPCLDVNKSFWQPHAQEPRFLLLGHNRIRDLMRDNQISMPGHEQYRSAFGVNVLIVDDGDTCLVLGEQVEP